MKTKIYLLIVVVLTISGFQLFNSDDLPSSLAVSGACSYHGGVNCSLGPDFDDSVICNDGWSDSSVNYWDMVECKNYLCPAQKVLWDMLYAQADWSLGPSKIFEDAGLPTSGTLGYSKLQQSLEMRRRELQWQYDSIVRTVDSYRYLCKSGSIASPQSYNVPIPEVLIVELQEDRRSWFVAWAKNDDNISYEYVISKKDCSSYNGRWSKLKDNTKRIFYTPRTFNNRNYFCVRSIDRDGSKSEVSTTKLPK